MAEPLAAAIDVSCPAPWSSPDCSFIELQAVVADKPKAFTPAAINAKQAVLSTDRAAQSFPCNLKPLHLAAALGRERCIRALLDAGADPFAWTHHPSTSPSTCSDEEDNEEEEEEEEGYLNYEHVCSSPTYLALKRLLPSSSEFPYTFTLAQHLLRTPCGPLMLAVRFGRQGSARCLLAAMERAAVWGTGAVDQAGVSRQGGKHPRASTSAISRSSSLSNPTSASSSGDGACGSSSSSSDNGGRSTSDGSASSALARHLECALAVWPTASEPDVGLLRRLLSAAGSGAFRRLLPAVLSRYENCGWSSTMAEKLRAGLREVLAHALPKRLLHPQVELSTSSAALGKLPVLRQLLTAAVTCRDEARSMRLLHALDGFHPLPWNETEANCALLVAAAAHDMAGVVAWLLERPAAVEGGTPPFNANMWGADGLSVLMAAAHRGSLAVLQVLLDAGAAINLADEMGCTALHWGVVGGSQEAVMLLAQRGAAVDATGVVHEEEEHLERALLTAVARSNLPMIRLLVGLGADVNTAAPTGASPLSVAVCWEQLEALRLLLDLGADPDQILPRHINGGCYPMWSDSYGAEEARTLLGMACSRIDFSDHIFALLKGGADPTLRHPCTGHTPAAEACSIGAVEEAAALLSMAKNYSLQELGWIDAVAQAAANHCWHHSVSPATALDPLLDVWEARNDGSASPEACCMVVTMLLRHSALLPAEGTDTLQAGAELAGVLQAERLAAAGICADLTPQLPRSKCPCVILAAAPAATRWSPGTHRHFPPTFKRTVRLLLLVNHRLMRAAGPGGRSGTSASSSNEDDSALGEGAAVEQPELHQQRAAEAVSSPCVAVRSSVDRTPAAVLGLHPALWLARDSEVGPEAHPLRAEMRAEGAEKKRATACPASGTPELVSPPCCVTDSEGLDGTGTPSTPCGQDVLAGGSGSDSTPVTAGEELLDRHTLRSLSLAPVSPTAAVSFSTTAGGLYPAGLHRDALLEVVRRLGAVPLSFWMQPQAAGGA